MRRALSIAVALIVTACASSSSESAGSSPSSTSDTAAPVTEPTIETTTASTSSSTSTSVPAPVAPALDFQGADAALAEAVDAFGADSVEATLVEFAALTGPLPSVPDVRPDETVAPLLSDVIGRLRELDGQIPPDDQEIIDERIEELIGGDFAFRLDGTPIPLLDDGGDTPGDTDGPEGFRSPGDEPADDDPEDPGEPSEPAESAPIVDDDVRDDLRPEWIAAVGRTWGLVAGNLPPPSDLDVAVVVSTPSFWDPEKIDVTREPGAAMIPGSWVQGDSSLSLLRSRYGNHDCYLVIGRERNADGSSPVAKAVVAHEMFHCWHYVFLDREIDNLYGSGAWAYEGLAAWVGEDISGGTYYAGRWLNRYAGLDFSLFDSSYDALGFWGRVNEATNLWGLVPGLVTTSAAGSPGPVMEEAIAAIDPLGPFISSGVLQDASLGFEWTAGPWMPGGISRTPATASASATEPFAIEVGPGEQTARTITVDAPDSFMVDLLITGYSVGTWRDDETVEARVGDPVNLRYCAGDCTCPDGTLPFFDADLPAGASELTVALSGSGTAGAGAAITVFESDCEPEPGPEADGDGLLATWRATPQSVAAAFARASGFDEGATGPVEPLDIAAATGDVLMTFEEGGTGSLVYDQVTLFFNDAPLTDITLNGTGTFTWTGGGAITITGTDYAFSVSSTVLGDDAFTLSSADLPGGGATQLGVFVGGPSLTVTAVDGSQGEVFFPVAWIRQSESD